MEDKINAKSRLLLLLSKQQGEFLPSDSKLSIISNYDELKKIISYINEKPNENIFEFIYSFKTVIHNSILYKEEKIINIGKFKLKNTLGELYYLLLLIIDTPEIINYEYSFEFVKKIYNFGKNIKNNNKLLKIVISKIIFEIINNFCETDNYDEKLNGKDIEIFKNEINTTIKNSIDIFKDFNLDINEENIQNLKVPHIICETLISFIKQNKFDDYDYIYSFIDAIDLKNIRIGKQILNPLKEILDKKNDFMKPYIINSKDHLYDKTRINFYYILLKFILKDPIYIYQIDFLNETRNRILNIIKSHEVSNDNLNNVYLERRKYVLETFAGSGYLIKNALLKLKEVLSYYQFYFFESKKEEIKQIKEHIKMKNTKSKYLLDYEKAVKANNVYPIIKNIFFDAENKEIISENELKGKCENWNIIYKCICEKKISKLRNSNAIKNLRKLIEDKNNKEMLLKIFDQNHLNNFIEQMKKEKKEKIEKKNDDLPAFKFDKKDIKETLNAPIFSNIPNDKNENKNQILNTENETKDKIGCNEVENYKKNEQKNSESNPNNFKSTKSNSLNCFSEENIINKKSEKNVKKNKFLDNNNNNFKSKNYEAFEYYLFGLAKKILNKCTIDLSIGKNGNKNYLVIHKIIVGQNNEEIKVEKFSNYLKSSMSLKNRNDDLKENSYRFANFMKVFEERIINEYNNNFYLNLQIEITNTNKNNVDKSFNLEAIYTFYQPLDGKPLKYKEDNILKNGVKSNLKGFNLMILDINLEKFKNVIYKEKNTNFSWLLYEQSFFN